MRRRVRRERSWQRTRWLGGRTLIWIGRRKTAGRGEGLSDLMLKSPSATWRRGSPELPEVHVPEQAIDRQLFAMSPPTLYAFLAARGDEKSCRDSGLHPVSVTRRVSK